MANIVKMHTVSVAAGDTYTTKSGARQIDAIYNGTVDAVSFTGTFDIFGEPSVPAPVPPGVPWYAPFNENGYDSFVFVNNGDAPLYLVLYF